MVIDVLRPVSILIHSSERGMILNLRSINAMSNRYRRASFAYRLIGSVRKLLCSSKSFNGEAYKTKYVKQYEVI